MKKLSTQHNNPAGFTLIELMIVIGIIPILTMMLVMTLTLYPRKYAEIEQDRLMTEQARNALGFIGRDIRSARAVATGAGTYTTGESDTLVLNMGGGGARRIVWTIQDGAIVRIVFADDDGQRESGRMKLSGSAAKLAFVFDSWPPTTSRISVKVKLARPIMDQERNIDLGGNFFLRGKLK